MLRARVASFITSTWHSRIGIRGAPFATAWLIAIMVFLGVVLSSIGIPFSARAACVASHASGTDVWLSVCARAAAEVVERVLASIGYRRKSRFAVRE